MSLETMTSRNLRRSRVLAVLGAALVAVLAGCAKPVDHPVGNLSPHVRVTGGPVQGSRAAYTALVYWTGWDDDGVIDHYEYALDPPPVFSFEEIAAPESAGTVAVTVVRGPSVREDTLRVSKTVAGKSYSFDWVQTVRFSRSFAFNTPVADTVYVGGLRQPDDQFSGYHAIYLRAQDNDGAYSAPDRLAYTAETQTPTATIARPAITASYLTVGSTVTVAWDGVDPDSPEPKKKPVGYIYRLLDLASLPNSPSILHVQPWVLFGKAGLDSVWTYQSADTLQKTFFLNTGSRYVFGVRAVDVAGAVEPFLDYGRNAFRFQSLNGSGTPTLTVSEPSLGSFNFNGSGTLVNKEVPVGAKLRFRWTATAEAYGGLIDGYSWGVDVPDLDREGPNSGWSGWGLLAGNFTPIAFDQPGVHVFYVRARDLNGTITLATIILEVIDFPLDKDLLLIDDYFDDTIPRDSEHDAFWAGIIRDSGRFEPTTTAVYATHGADDHYSINPSSPPLSTLGSYRTLIWNTRGGGTGGTALTQAAARDLHLGSYLSAGGTAWITGTMTVGAMLIDAAGTADLNYPKAIDPATFPAQFLKLYTSKINNDKGTDPKNNLLGVKPFPGKAVVYPAMEADSTKINPFKGGISHCDAIFDPMFVAGVAGFRGVLDSLYVSDTYANVVLKRGTVYQARLDAVRYHDPDPARTQGRTQWFGFPMYYFKQAGAQEVFNRSIDWFREEPLPQPPGQ